ncbi:hypothetical protein B0H34DRAFT_862310 [Crassisporium funariophilum]|nr:hypothetical protein B0H34DRAFT_862310 [Crassisporium funariophilum]
MKPFLRALLLGQATTLVILTVTLAFLLLCYEHEALTKPLFVYQPSNVGARHGTVGQPQCEIEGPQTTAGWMDDAVLNVYRSQLRGGFAGAEGDEVLRKKVEEIANQLRPSDYLDTIKIGSVNIGSSGPRLSNVRPLDNYSSGSGGTGFIVNVTYFDDTQVTFSTSYLLGIPLLRRFPISGNVRLAVVSLSLAVVLPLPDSDDTELTIELLPDISLEISTVIRVMGVEIVNHPRLEDEAQLRIRHLLNGTKWTLPFIPDFPPFVQPPAFFPWLHGIGKLFP